MASQSMEDQAQTAPVDSVMSRTGASGQATAWGVAAVAGLVSILLLVYHFRPEPPVDPPLVLRASISAPEGAEFGNGTDILESQVAVSPDGRKIAFVAGNRLWIRPLDRAEAEPLAETDNALYPFWSADSSTLGFFADGQLKKVPASGGPVTAIAEAPQGRGGSWGPDDTILFAPESKTGIHRVDAGGGEVRTVTQIDRARHTTHRWPEYLADGKSFLFLATSHSHPRGSESGIYLSSIDGGSPQRIAASDSKPVLSAGQLLYMRAANLVAQDIDLTRLGLHQDDVQVAEGVRYRGESWAGSFSGSGREVLAYETGAEDLGSRLTWMDRLGNEEGTLGERQIYWDLKMSPQGDRLAMAQGSTEPELWIQDVEGGTRLRLSKERGFSRAPVWSPDGDRLAFAAMNEDGRLNMFVASAHGEGRAELLMESAIDQVPTSWSPDGQWLAFDQGTPGATEIWVLSMTDELVPFPFVQTPAWAGDGQFSPDGKLILYTSRDSGVDQVYVSPFLEPTTRWQLSASGRGSQARWSPTGKEVYFVTSQAMLMEVSLRRPKGGGLDVGMPRMLFSIRADHSLFRGHGALYDVIGEGETFLLAQGPERDRNQGLIRLVVPWTAALAE